MNLSPLCVIGLVTVTISLDRAALELNHAAVLAPQRFPRCFVAHRLLTRYFSSFQQDVIPCTTATSLPPSSLWLEPTVRLRFSGVVACGERGIEPTRCTDIQQHHRHGISPNRPHLLFAFRNKPRPVTAFWQMRLSISDFR